MLAPQLPRFMERYPRVRIELDVDNRRVDLLGEGFDAALRVRSEPSGEDGVVMRRFAELSELLVASPAYLARAGTPRAPADLAPHATLSYETEREAQVWDLTGPGGESAHVEHVPRLRCHNFPVLHAAALSGHGVAMLPELVVRDALAAGTLVHVLQPWRLPLGVFHVVFPHRRGLLPAVRAFIDFLVETMPSAVTTAPSCPADLDALR